jgi:putative hemolysin
MSITAVLDPSCGELLASTENFRVGLAQSAADVLDCQRLRYHVFNCQLGEGLATSARLGLDRDKFDLICDHLMVRDADSSLLVGTYRLQSGYRAKGNLGYYSEQLFDLNSFEPFRAEVLELGRACVHEDYRNTTALHLLWKGIAIYAARTGARYLIGCSSIFSQNEAEGMALFEALGPKHLADPPHRTRPRPCCECRAGGEQMKAPRPPRLMRAYLDISARLCGPPAIDREFKTIDYLTLLDLENIPERVRTRFF